MREVEAWPGLKRLLVRHASAGGILDSAFFELESGEAADEHLMRRAAIRGLERIFADEAAQSPKWAARVDITTAIDYGRASEAIGQRISATDFMGPRWSPERRSLICQRIPEGRGASEWFYATDPPLLKYVLKGGPPFGLAPSGLAYVFSDSPHGLGLSAADMNSLFMDLCRELFPDGSDATSVQIWQWSTAWSWYFEAGHEWWGAFLWTVSVAPNRVYVLAASTTD